MEAEIYQVTVRLDGCHSLHTDYPLLQGDILLPEPGGTFYKHAPGLGICGFVLTDEQRATLARLAEMPPITFL